jgi:hypothetical protein
MLLEPPYGTLDDDMHACHPDDHLHLQMYATIASYEFGCFICLHADGKYLE